MPTLRAPLFDAKESFDRALARERRARPVPRANVRAPLLWAIAAGSLAGSAALLQRRRRRLNGKHR
jgi:hypothetical protein